MQHQSEESVFNMAMAYLKRIDLLLYKCQDAARIQDIDKWRSELRALWRELSVKVKPNEEHEILGDPNKKINYNKLIDNFVIAEEANFRNIDALANRGEYKYKYKQIILYLLDALEVKMRRKLQEKGMLLPSRADPRFAVLER
jgi:hypothetical protein